MWELIYVGILFILFSDPDFQKLVNGHPAQISRLYTEQKEVILTFLLRKFKGNREYAEDVLSSTFEAVCTAVSSLKSNENLTGWLITIAFKTYCKYVKKLKNEKAKLEKSIPSLHVDDLKEKRFIIYTAMQSLKKEYREILEMKYYAGKSQKEIAHLYNKTDGAIELMLVRSKKALKKRVIYIEDLFAKKGYL